MKNLFLSGITVLAFAVGLTSCQKEDAMSPENTGTAVNEKTAITTGVITPVPKSFTQKVLVEEFTSAVSGLSPEGVVQITDLVTNNPNTVIPVSVHHSDAMETSWYDHLNTTFNNHSLNSAMINRVMDKGSTVQEMQDWASLVNGVLDLSTDCGLALRTEIIGDNAQIDVHAGFAAPMSGDLYLTVYLLENQVSGVGPMYDQVNFFNGDANHPFYNTGSPIQGFKHNNVLREVLTTGAGELINPGRLITGGMDLKKYFVDISGYNINKSANSSNKLTVVAFIHRIGATADDQQVLNVQSCQIGSVRNWN